MVRDGYKSPGLGLEEMNMASRLPNRFETKSGEDFNNFRS